MSFQELFDHLNSAIDDEYFLTKKERDDYFDKYYSYDAESFEAIEMFDQNKEDFIGEIDLEGFSPDNFEVAQDDLFRYIHDSKRDGRTKMAMVAIYLQGRDNLGKMMGAETFEAQTKLTDYTRGKDWEGKPYTGQIFPDHPDLDPELADRNQDGKMASWERAIGNQVANGKSRFKAPRKMPKRNTNFTQRKPITAASSLLPYAIAVGALATILGLRGRK